MSSRPETWEELTVQITEALYEDARHCGLDTVKFLHDGRQVGSGGGNHIVVGAAAPTDSPFLRRPDLLASADPLLAEPPVAVLSLLGRFHRTDQPGARGSMRPARRCSTSWRLRWTRSARAGPNPPPWIVDRIFRDLMTDLTGNTHRAEICIDKLYEPRARRAGWAWSSSAPSRCRPIRAWRWPSRWCCAP